MKPELQTVPIICAKRPVRSGPIPAIRYPDGWRCSACGAQVRVAW